MSKFGLFAASVMTVTAVVALPTEAQAQQFVVCNSTALRNAISQAETTPGPAVLILSPGCTYTLTAPHNDANGLPVVTSQITIFGNGSTIRRVSSAEFRIFEVTGQNANLTLNNLTLRDARSPGLGGGAWLHGGGRITVNGSKIIHNSALGGGAITNEGGTVTVSSSDLMYNVTELDGGAYFGAPQSTATFRNSTISGNTSLDGAGGGFQIDGSLTLGDSTVAENSAAADGGGIRVSPDATATLTNTAVRRNTSGASGGGITNFSTLNVTGGEVFANRVIDGAFDPGAGGGIANLGVTAIATLTNTRVTYNAAHAAPGGILNSGGQVGLNSTVVANNTPTNCTPSTPAVPGCVN